MSVRLVVTGATGRMGRSICNIAKARGVPIDAAIALEVDASATPPIVGAVSDIPDTANCIIDFSSPILTRLILEDAPASVRSLIIGTTGLTGDDMAAMQRVAREKTVVYARNFSLGVNLLAMLSARVSASLGPDWDAEIHEIHHRHKVDAPSGTALMLAEAIEKDGERGAATAPYDGQTGARTQGAIGMSVSRMGGVCGTHTVSFGSESELLQFTHTALDRDVFAKGALYAADWAANQPAGLYDMADVLGALV